ncbi:MAG: hypothetical protein ABSB74_08280 [Tepidisphaeraceae bacterium]
MTKIQSTIAAIILAILSLPIRVHADDAVTLTSPDGQYRLVAPKGWGPAEFHVDNIQIGASNPRRGEYAEVVADRREDYVGSLQQFAEAKRDTMAMSLDNPRLSPAQQLKISGQDAFRFEIHGQLPGSKVSVGYCLTVLATKTHYIQVIGWAEDSHFADNRQELNSLAQGFSENAGAQK